MVVPEEDFEMVLETALEVGFEVVVLNVVCELVIDVTFEVECEVVLEVELEEVDTTLLLIDVLERPSAQLQAFQRPFGPSAGSGEESLGLSNT